MDYPQVLAKAAGGEPLLRVMIEATDRVAYLANPTSLDAVARGESDPVGFPLIDVFDPTPGLYNDLREFWEADDAAALEAMWGLARPVKIAAHV